MNENDKELEKLTGVVDRIVYQTKDNGYAVTYYDPDWGDAEGWL